jgi:hypothetical protein
MSTAGADFPIDRIATDDVADVARIAAVRDAYRRTIAEVEIAPHPVSPFYWRGVLRRLPGLALASAVSSGARITRTPTPDERDDLILTVAVEGRLTVRQGERETVLRTGEMAVTRSREASRCEREAHARSIELRIASHTIVPTARELDAIMVSPIAAPEPLAMLRRYVDGLLDSFGIERPETLNLAVAHVHEIVSYILGAARDGAAAEKARGPAAARLRAIKADIVENLWPIRVTTPRRSAPSRSPAGSATCPTSIGCFAGSTPRPRRPCARRRGGERRSPRRRSRPKWNAAPPTGDQPSPPMMMRWTEITRATGNASVFFGLNCSSRSVRASRATKRLT